MNTLMQPTLNDLRKIIVHLISKFAMSEDDTNKRIETITEKIQKNKAELKKKLFKEFL